MGIRGEYEGMALPCVILVGIGRGAEVLFHLVGLPACPMASFGGGKKGGGGIERLGGGGVC